MVEFIKEFSIDDVVKNSQNRRFTAYGSVEIYDRHNQLLPISEFIKSMDNYMSNSRILLDSHTNKPVGKVLNWTQVKKDGANAIKITGEIYKDSRRADKVWQEIKEGKREGISVGGSTESIEKGENGEILRGIEIDEFSIVERCGNQGAVFDAISMAKSEDISKQTADTEQTTQESSQNDEQIKNLEQKVDFLMNEFQEVKSLISSKPDMEKTEKMEEDKNYKKENVQTQEEVSNEEVTKTQDETNQEVTKEEQSQDTSQDFNMQEFAKSIQDSLNNLTQTVEELKKSQKENSEELQVIKTESIKDKEVSESSNKYKDVIKSVQEGKIDKFQAIEQLMEEQ